MGRRERMTSQEACRAVYLDFEGNVDETPSVLGVRCEDRTTQFILEPALASLGDLRNSKYDVRLSTLEGVMSHVQDVAAAEHRRIAGFTTHEAGVVNTYCGDDALRDWFASAYVNVKKPIDRWVRAQVAAGGHDPVQDRSLLTYMRFADIAYKPGCGPGIVGPGLTRLRAQIARHGSAAQMSKGTKLHWWRILSHNATDLVATQELTRLSAEEN